MNPTLSCGTGKSGLFWGQGKTTEPGTAGREVKAWAPLSPYTLREALQACQPAVRACDPVEGPCPHCFFPCLQLRWGSILSVVQ